MTHRSTVSKFSKFLGLWKLVAFSLWHEVVLTSKVENFLAKFILEFLQTTDLKFHPNARIYAEKMTGPWAPDVLFFCPFVRSKLFSYLCPTPKRPLLYFYLHAPWSDWTISSETWHTSAKVKMTHRSNLISKNRLKIFRIQSLLVIRMKFCVWKKIILSHWNKHKFEFTTQRDNYVLSHDFNVKSACESINYKIKMNL